MPCLSSSALSALNDSISVSNAESQLAWPLATTTFLPSSVIGSPKGSAVCTGAAGAGVCATEGEGLAAGDAEASGVGLAGAAGAGLADADGAGVGCWASADATPNQIAATGINAIRVLRVRKVIQLSPSEKIMIPGLSKPNTPRRQASPNRSVI